MGARYEASTLNAGAFIDQLTNAGIRLVCDDNDLIADVLPDATLDPFCIRIQEHKPALLTELRLREEIVAAASVDPEHFDPAELDRLWTLWHEHNPKEAP